MKDIIAQTAGRLVEEIFNTIEKVGLSNVGKTAEELFAVLKNGTLELLSAAISEMDAAVLSAKKERKSDGLTVKERNVPRTFTTSLGELHYKRTYFSLKDGPNVYLIDHLIGVEPNERLSKQLCAEFVNYFQNNWDSIVERLNGGHPGICTEPLISHVLSERLSRNPLAWSREGLEQMTMLRIFTENGGKVTADHIRVSRSRKERAKDHNGAVALSPNKSKTGRP